MTVVSKQKSIIMPELLLHVNGFYAHLNVIQSEMESGNATATDTSEEIILELLLPTSSCVVLTKFLDTSPMESMTFALSADYNPMSDSHLVCSQLGKVCTEAVNSVCHIDTGFPSGIYSKTNSNRNYFPSQNRSKSFQTGAISIENTQPKITGVSFVAFSGHASCCSAVIIEDGVYIALTRSKFYQLVSSLKAGSDVSIQIQPNSRNRSAVVTQIHDDRVDDVAENQVTNADNVASSIHIKWFKVFDAFLSSASFSSTVTSPCYASSLGVWDLEPINTFLVPVHYQLSHWLHLNAGIISSGTNHFSSRPTVGSTNAPLLRLAWIRFHILNVQELEIIGTHSPKPLTFGHLANEVAECVTRALQPYLVHLRSNSRTQITLRIQLQSPDQVGYRMGASCQDVYTLHNQLQSSVDLETSDLEMKKNDEEIYADALDDVLLPVLSSWINCLRFVNQKEKEVKLSSPTTPVDDVGGGDGINENDIIQMEFDFCILD
ncbi:unnamed protein product [Heterobilharzia americana]|nr:unnamed protein product [Heterobilharzia americana]